jgi:hypothetical protein
MNQHECRGGGLFRAGDGFIWVRWGFYLGYVGVSKPMEANMGGMRLWPEDWFNLVHTGSMSAIETLRQSVSLPKHLATQVRSMAKSRRVSANRILVELIENGIQAEQQKEKAFFELAERFRAATDPEEVRVLGEEMGRMVFGE